MGEGGVGGEGRGRREDSTMCEQTQHDQIVICSVTYMLLKNLFMQHNAWINK